MNKLLCALTILFSLSFTCLAGQDPVSWKFSLADKGRGEIELVATATIDKGWHLYDTEILENGPFPTSVEIEQLSGAEAIGTLKATDSKRIEVFDKVFQMKVGYFDGKAVFVQRFRLLDKATFTLRGDIRAMACSDGTCTAPLPIEFSFASKDLPAGAILASASTDISKNPTEGTIADNRNTIGHGDGIATTKPDGIAGMLPDTIPGAGSASLTTGADSTSIAINTNVTGPLWRPVVGELRAFGAAGDTSDHSLLLIFIFGFAGGLLALLTPCVWPMIPLTVSFFIKRTNKRSKAVRDAFIYGFSIIAIYLILGLVITGIFGASALNNLATNAVFNIIFFVLLVVFALSFLGAFELTLPSRWTNKMNEKADTSGGLTAIFFMAFTLTLVSFSCTGPIIGTLLVDAAGMGTILSPAVGMFGFALALAIPFALFALFPSWLSNLPRSGGWMNSVKVTLGMLELALALKFFSVADLAYGWGILDRETFIILWIVIFSLLGFYLLGKFRFSHDSQSNHVSVPRFFLSIISLAFALYMLPGLWGAPLKAVSAFLPPLSTQDFNLYDGSVHARFNDYESGMEYARRAGKPVMIDFSGFGCVNCREMEARVWTDPRVKSILDNDYVLITLMVDDRQRLPQTIEVEENGRTVRLKSVGDKWSYLQRHKFGTNSQPYYVLLSPDGNPIGPSYGYNDNIGDYIRFLETGLENFKSAR